MKLKALLLGSAAAMIAVSTAQAADAVIAEPEPVEYVRVCDLYGAGFHYIPGTETCLRFDGYVRVDFTFGEDGGAITDGDDDFSRWDYRARVNIDARNETDYGTLRSEIRLQADGNGGVDGDVGIDRALIHLAGFRLGYSDSFTTTFHGYGIPVEKYDGYYAYDQAIFWDYTYAANGFEAGIGVQDSLGNGNADREIDADYYAGLAYGGSWGRVAASYIYESGIEEGAYKLSANLNLIEGLTLKGFFVGDDDGQTRQVSGAGEYAWGVGAAYQFTPEFRLHAGYSDRDGGAVDGDDTSAFAVVGGIWNPVSGLSIRPEARFGVDDDNDDEAEFSIRVYRTW